MVGLARRILRRWWLPARLTDAQLMRPCELQVQDLIDLAAAATNPIGYNKGRRMWRLADTLPAAVRFKC